ncbi:type I polyketide synthase [Streptomyces tropicalis]|uniref:Beta-ketoacyl synthase N-terminal-like domain-containing protein n=1 Tax=Streptomyces tropicalis TaxID=3034234 RepID=A0ABT6A861_9ACTN|nr:beta-ketoacyl synthase N-terminal-like domain-containing protein [Streptomyces tropicalis]MDF3300837.1 beta-ketoacyl synthase N-terminal-like domain-containing protein [Streptomyces tropicalis]
MPHSPVEGASLGTLDENAVAVVGMACRLPGARDVRAFRALLRAGRDGISRLSPEELLRRGADPAYTGRENFVPVMGVVEESRCFDWAFFRYSRAEAAAMDPQQRVFLECAATAVDDAGLDPVRFRGRVGVYAGADRSGPGRDDSALGELARYIGREKDFVATRVAYKLGLRGPALTVQTACSTSLTAVHLAVRALRGGECDAALAGGVTVMPAGEWGYLFEPGGILAPDGYCRPFDARSAGTVPSEGVGVVVLKRLADAVRDGDRIAAVIVGTAVNNDGAEKMAYTAPSAAGQSEVVRAALADAGLAATAVGHVEAHGTATRLGDPIEVQALTEVYGEGSGETGWCALGAVKSQVGHTGAAAGVTGLIKTALMLEYREIYPTAHFTEPNPLLELQSSPFRVAAGLAPWELRAGQELRVGAVSSFGVGGTNAHAVLTEAPAGARDGAARPAAGPRLLPLSAHGPAALARLDDDLSRRFSAEDAPGLDTASWTLAGRRIHRHRQAVVVRDGAHAPEALRAAGAAAGRLDAPRRLGRVAFLLPGQGTLTSAAGEAAHRLLPEFRAAFDEIRTIAFEDCGVDLGPVVAPPGPGPDGGRDADDWYADTVHQQLGLFALGCAFGRQLATWGVVPHAMLGNSIGEYTAAALAGVWTLPDAVTVVHRRAVAMRDTAPGRMAVVGADPADVEARLPEGCDIAVAVRGNGSAVLSGPGAAMDALLAGDALSGLRVTPVHTRRAFHSPAMNSAAEAVRDHLSSMPARPPRLPYISNTTGGWADPEAVTTPGHWAAHVREPVRLDTGTATLLASGCTTYLELGPGGSMTGSLRGAPGWDPGHRTVRLAPGGRADAETGLLDAIGALWELGVDAALETLLQARYPAAEDRPRRCSLPAHPLLGEDPEADAVRSGGPHPRRGRPSAGARPDRPLRGVLEEVWCQILGAAPVSDEDDFFAHGGESLLAIALATAVRERTGTEISVTDFTRRATFAGLVGLVERQRPGRDGPATAPPGTATLREGTGRAVFLVADALGTALPYRDLADRLDLADGRPLLALERSAPRGGTIRALAAAHARTLTEAQPTGPYTLGGWSFGAVVAHETARLLIRRGRAVDLLVLLDGYVPDTRPLPVAAAPDFLFGGARAGLDTLLGVGPTAGALRRSPLGRRRFLGGQAAVLAHRPGPVDCPAVLFKADAGPGTAARLTRRLAGLYPAGLRVIPVAGDHWSMLRPPYVDELATRVADELKERNDS